MASSKRTRVAYRPSHYQLPIISIILEKKIHEQFGLAADFELVEKNETAERLLTSGEIEFIIGNHIVPMADRCRSIPIIYMAQAINWSVDRLAAGPGVKDLAGLKGKRITFGGEEESHPSLTKRLYFERAGIDLKADKIEVKYTQDGEMGQIQAVVDRKVDAAIIGSPFDIKARKMGLRIIDLAPIPMVLGLTVTTMSPFARENPLAVKRLVQTISAGVHHYKTEKKESLRIMKARLANSKRLELDSDDLVEHLYSDTADLMERKPYPTTDAVKNVHKAAMILHPEVKGLNPLSMWDLRYTRELDEEGFFDRLYSQ